MRRRRGRRQSRVSEENPRLAAWIAFKIAGFSTAKDLRSLLTVRRCGGIGKPMMAKADVARQTATGRRRPRSHASSAGIGSPRSAGEITDATAGVHRGSWDRGSVAALYCGPVLRHPAELLPAADLGGRVWLGGRSCKGWPAAPAFGG